MHAFNEFSRPQDRLSASSLLSKFNFSVCKLIAAMALLCAAVSAHAVVVRGAVTDQLGAAVRGARVNLMQNGHVVASVVSGYDGSYELTSANSGRFVVTGAAGGFALAISEEFYSGTLDVVTESLVMRPTLVREEVTVVASGMPTPEAQLSTTVHVISDADLATRVGVLDDLRQMPGVSVVQSGQYGGITSLFVRGGASVDNKVLLDGISVNTIGGLFDFGTVSSTGLERIEAAGGPDSALFGTEASASVISMETPRGVTSRPVLNYSGDAGNLHTWRNEISVADARRKTDYWVGYSRFDSSNALQLDRDHDSTSAANLGYSPSGATQLRFTIRNSDSAEGVPNAHDFYGISDDGKQADQDTYAGLTLEHRSASDWHSLVRYGISRKREQYDEYFDTGTIISGCVYGHVVTIRGANGTSGTGQAELNTSCGANLPGWQDQFASNRDELDYQTDYRFTPHVAVYGSFQYERERGMQAFAASIYGPEEIQTATRTNYNYALQLAGDFKSRFFYSLGGGFVKNQIFGTRAEPRIGFSYYPVHPDSGRFFHGTKLRFNFSKGVQEADLGTQLDSLNGVLQSVPGGTALAQQYNIQPVDAQESRSYEGGVDQSIIGQRLMLKASIFHNEFGRQVEFVDASTLGLQPFNLPASIVDILNSQLGGSFVNTLAYKALGAEAELQWSVTERIFFRGGYSYLDTVTQHSFSSDALSPQFNPNYPNTPIGASDPLIGARAFRRPPHTGFFAVDYRGRRFTTMFKGAMASRSDDTTALVYFDALSFDNSLLLPNRDLAFGWVKLDLGGTYQFSPRVQIFTQLDNLLNNQHIGPIGYPGLPFTVRAGLKVRLGGN